MKILKNLNRINKKLIKVSQMRTNPTRNIFAIFVLFVYLHDLLFFYAKSFYKDF